jgi:hypothetical protein
MQSQTGPDQASVGGPDPHSPQTAIVQSDFAVFIFAKKKLWLVEINQLVWSAVLPHWGK